MKVSDYIPDLYKDNVEMSNIINAEEVEFEFNLEPSIENAFKDNFAKTATINGIEKYEKLLNIKLDENKDNLEYRKAIIINKLSTTAPITYRWLEVNLTNLVGENNYKIDLDINNYKIKINIANVYINIAETLYNIYRKLLPANLEIAINVFETYYTQLYMAGVAMIGEKMLIKGEEVF